MDETTNPLASAGDGRQRNGTFAPGNSIGRGNPHARRVHALKATLLDAVTADDLRSIVGSMVGLAKGGDVAAAKLVLEHTIGKPAATVSVTSPDGESLGLDWGRVEQAVLAAQDSATQLQLAAEAAQVGIYSFDLQTREHVWSPELKAIFGMPPEAPAPAEIIPLIHPEDRERFSAVLRASFDPSGDGAFQDEHRVVRTDGRIRWVLAKGRMSFVEEGGKRKAKRGVGFVLRG